jgi:AcrR family transcriptional regulator
MASRAAKSAGKGTEATQGRGRKRDLGPPHADVDTSRDRDELHRRSQLLWESQQRPSRGPKPTVTREDVVTAAITIADRDGLGALTMHAVADSLGFTTMALYRYFPNKEAIIDASVDAALGTPPARTGPREGWRAEVRHWCYAKRAMLCSRPWLAELPFVAAPHGPNWLSWHEAFLQTIADTGLSPEDMMDVLSVVHGYVSGSSDTAISLARATSRGISTDEWAQAVSADLCRAINDLRYPLLSGILTSQSGGISEASPLPARGGRARTMDESFDFGLQVVLDGIERYIDSHRGQR